jgi:hypothetical protein
MVQVMALLEVLLPLAVCPRLAGLRDLPEVMVLMAQIIYLLEYYQALYMTMIMVLQVPVLVAMVAEFIYSIRRIKWKI